jgi:hypothetical protein
VLEVVTDEWLILKVLNLKFITTTKYGGVYVRKKESGRGERKNIDTCAGLRVYCDNIGMEITTTEIY